MTTWLSTGFTLAAALAATADAAPPRLLAREVPMPQISCGASTATGFGVALAADGSLACEVNCGTTSGGSKGYYIYPDGQTEELTAAGYTFLHPEFIVGPGRTIGTADQCPPVNGACVTSVVISQGNGPTATLGTSASAASYTSAGNMAGWACGWGPVSTTGAWRYTPLGTLESLAAPGGNALNAAWVTTNGHAAGSGYFGSLKRALHWAPDSAQATVLSPLVAGTSCAASGAADDGSVVGQSGGRATIWGADGTPTALLPAGAASECTHVGGSRMAANPLGVSYFGTHNGGNRLFRATAPGVWQDLGPDPTPQHSYISAKVVAAPRPDLMVGLAHTEMYQPVAFLWTLAGGTTPLASAIVNLPSGLGGITPVDANSAGQILVNGISARRTFVLEFLAPGDVNGDARVDGTDLGLLLGSWGPVPAGARGAADLDGDGMVDGTDLGLLLGLWTS